MKWYELAMWFIVALFVVRVFDSVRIMCTQIAKYFAAKTEALALEEDRRVK